MGKLKITIIILITLFFSGCSTVSYVLNPPPDVSELYYTEDDVKEVINEISTGEPTGEITFDGENYVMSPEVYKNAIRDGVIKEVQEKKIREFVSEYKRDTFMGELKKDAGTAGLVILIMLGAGIFLGF